MHIAEGVLSAPVLAAGAAGAAVGSAYGLKKLDEEDIPKTAIVSAALFVASLLHLPLGPTSVHLILNGFGGVILGWKIFPVFLLVLFLQAVLFQFGGLTVIGVNTILTALPGFLAFLLFRITAGSRAKEGKKIIIAGFGAGFIAVLGSALLLMSALIITEGSFRELAIVISLSYIPLALLEGSLTAVIISFLLKNKPEILRIN
ncbi:cobalt transporter CbiM [Halanaerobium sp. Z-7514]|uniref:Cobalt transporter CbiM n=1 Tax=Halanaerobium polyolivorans TaxID=2886943 RepID=A0AAW4X135_9FIRM|nr:cobalt transporter CbiM [Halanaerobium polyolivorans]MCC3145493.1 cobalt transporter CbiM [Halanaerobium polyolivorans]